MRRRGLTHDIRNSHSAPDIISFGVPLNTGGCNGCRRVSRWCGRNRFWRGVDRIGARSEGQRTRPDAAFQSRRSNSQNGFLERRHRGRIGANGGRGTVVKCVSHDQTVGIVVGAFGVKKTNAPGGVAPHRFVTRWCPFRLNRRRSGRVARRSDRVTAGRNEKRPHQSNPDEVNEIRCLMIHNDDAMGLMFLEL